MWTLVIFPVTQVIELCYHFLSRVFNNPALSLAGLSAAVSALTLPLYIRAEKWQKAERETQKRLAPKTAKIRAVFSGDERYMLLSTYYRQNKYHPVYALRNSFGILIQVPFFIAAYTFISHLESLRGVSFLFIKDLSAPDAILTLNGGGGVNLLPLLMTALNCASGAVYTRGFAVKDKIQIYGIAAVFLVLLYNSPSGLVFYWTCNNLFSLAKNLLSKTNHKKTIVYSILFSGAFVLDLFLLFRHRGDLPNRLLAMAVVSLVFLLPLAEKAAARAAARHAQMEGAESEKGTFAVYLLSCLVLFLLLGIAVPASLAGSSVPEFSFLGKETTPLAFIFSIAKQAAGICLFWPLAVYFLFTRTVRRALTYTLFLAAGVSLVNVFMIRETFGFITTTLAFSEVKPFSMIPAAYLINLVEVSAAVFILFLVLKKTGEQKSRFIVPAQAVVAAALTGISLFSCLKIHNEFTALEKTVSGRDAVFDEEFVFSSNGKNVLLIMLDCVTGFYLPYIFEEKPELRDSFSGFTQYINCASYANHTLVGALPLYGGYEYTPKAVNERSSEPLLEKQKEAYLLLPKLFNGAGYSVTVTDPPFDNFQMSNLSPFSSMPEIRAKNLTGKYTAAWLKNHRDISAFETDVFLKNTLLRFSFFKSAPLFLRLFIYDDGAWLAVKKPAEGKLTAALLDDYALLDSLDAVTAFTDKGNTYTAFYVHFSHGTALLQPPDYTPSEKVRLTGTGPLAADGFYHTTTASLLLLEKWFDLLKKNGAYDNTRILLVSDHGRGGAGVPENIRLPGGGSVQGYNPLLMVKDFNAKGGFVTDTSFMTNADAVLIALSGIVENPANPWTGKPLTPDKNNGIFVTTIGALSTYRHNKYGYNIKDTEWLFVRDNVFDADKWKAEAPDLKTAK